jgi:hypothetical protein
VIHPGPQDRLDPSQQLSIVRALSLYEVGAARGGRILDGLPKFDLDTIRAGRRGVVIASGPTFHAPFVTFAVEKKWKKG